MRPRWIINRHTRACFGPYETNAEAMEDITNDPHPDDWALVREIDKPQKRAKPAEK
jgi:hypothetical protein